MEDENKNNPQDSSEDTPENKPEVPEDSFIKHQKENIQQEQKTIDVYSETMKWFDTNPDVLEFSEQFNKMSWDSFKKYYATYKTSWVRNGSFFIKQEEKRKLLYYNKAFECLWEIQQRKLFNKNCLWRAEQIELPEISVVYEFNYWSNNIEKCPFLEPISEEEFHVYLSYLRSGDYEADTLWFLRGWQDYDEWKNEVESDDESISYPEWYSFYDGRMGTSYMLTLPDLRTEKENKYEHAWQKSQPPPPPPKPGTPAADKRPSYQYYQEGGLEWFIKEFDPSIMRSYKAVTEGSRRSDNPELESALMYLEDIDGYAPIEGGMDWREQVVKAYREHYKLGVIEEFENAYNDYLSQLAMGFTFGDDNSNKADMNFVDLLKKQVLAGRKLLGEPEDFNY